MRSYIVKKNHIGLAVSEILRYRQTEILLLLYKDWAIKTKLGSIVKFISLTFWCLLIFWCFFFRIQKDCASRSPRIGTKKNKIIHNYTGHSFSSYKGFFHNRSIFVWFFSTFFYIFFWDLNNEFLHRMIMIY